MPKFPDRWLDYTNVGKVIAGTRIITFKVPLKESFFVNNQKSSEIRFTPETLIDSIDEQGLKLGLVIDLTNTKRYYDEEEFTNKGVDYKKIFVEGHVIPSQDVIDQFYKAIDNFIEKSEEDSYIGVHCTHGVNRTGYVVCRYMVEHLGMKATDSLEAYRIGRGYPVERINYINDLKRRAGEPVPKEDEEREEKEKQERAQKGKKQNFPRHQDGSRSDRSDWRSDNQHHQNDPRWDRNYGYQGAERFNGRYNENYDYGQGCARNYGQHDSRRSNEYSHHDQYGSGSDNWRNSSGQCYNEDVINQYDLDPNTWYGYQRPSQPQSYHGYSNGPSYSNNTGPTQSLYLENCNQVWGSGANQGMTQGYGGHIQNEGYSDNSCGNNSYDSRSYSRQNSYSRRQGRPNKGNDRMKPF